MFVHSEPKTDEEAATEITAQILRENIPNIGIAAWALAEQIVSALVEVEIIKGY